MIGLVQAHSERQAHTIDLPYRLSSWAFDDPANVRLWQASDGSLMGWAAVQIPSQMLDLAIRPEQAGTGLRAEMLAWGLGRAQDVVTARGRDLRLYVACPDDDGLASLVVQHGFELARWGTVNLVRHLDTALAPVTAPEGFGLRSSHGRGEAAEHAALHRAAFGSDAMTEGWRARF